MLYILFNDYQWSYEIVHKIMCVGKYAVLQMQIKAVIVESVYIMQIITAVSLHFHSSNYLTAEQVIYHSNNN